MLGDDFVNISRIEVKSKMKKCAALVRYDNFLQIISHSLKPFTIVLIKQVKLYLKQGIFV